MRYFLRASPRRTYDQFFASRSRVRGIQFWGLMILGGPLIAAGLGLLALFPLKISKESLDAFGMIVFLIPGGICGAIIWLGILHIERAFAGRHSHIKQPPDAE